MDLVNYDKKVYDKIVLSDRIGYIRECYDLTFYEWLQTQPKNKDVEILKI